MKTKTFLLLLLPLLCVLIIGAYLTNRTPPEETKQVTYLVPPEETPQAADFENPVAALSCRVPVSDNRHADVLKGFEGELHPLLHLNGPTEVRAFWDPPVVDRLDPNIPGSVRRLYTGVAVAVPRRSYTASDFSVILPPANVDTPGELWWIDPENFARFLTQFHPNVSMHSASVGRRPGPDGAFAVLRAISPSRVDVVFRVHGEFDLLPHSANLPIRNAWYSPACFLGRLIVNHDTGTVEYFQLGVPADKVNNVHTTMWIIDGPNGGHFHHMHSVDRMELVGGSVDGLNETEWTSQIETSAAHDMLVKVFYKFNEIDFRPFDQILSVAGEQEKPIMAVVLLGALQDQSC